MTLKQKSRINRLLKARTSGGGPTLYHGTHVCDGTRRCLGPLAFHTGAVGSRISLSLGARRADRARCTFQHGVVFSSRPLRVGERLRLRVDAYEERWEGALRLGFTAAPPSPEAPPPAMAIPDLTDRPGHWLQVVPEALASLGSELQFWVDSNGRVRLKGRGWPSFMLMEGVDVSQELWAVIDVYGTTCAVLLLGSKKKGTFMRSCPAPPPPPVSHDNSCCLCASKGGPCLKRQTPASQAQQLRLSATAPSAGFYLEEGCSVCLLARACVVLSCGHRCLCVPCTSRVVEEFGHCPLCRQPITGPCDLSEG